MAYLLGRIPPRHWGPLRRHTTVVAEITKARTAAELPPIIVDVHPDRPDQRGSLTPLGVFAMLPPQPTLDATAAAGGQIAKNVDVHPVAELLTSSGSDAAAMFLGLCAGWSDPNRNVEHLDVFGASAEASTMTSLGSLPMSIITAVDPQTSGLSADEAARITDIWDRGQQECGQLSTASNVVSVEDTSHYIQLVHPDVVIDEVTRLRP